VNEKVSKQQITERIVAVGKRSSKKVIDKPWGLEQILYEDDTWRIKRIVVQSDHRTSLQYHEKKFEVWFFEDGSMKVIPPMSVHRLTGPITVIELAHGDDMDIMRLEDDYGREKDNEDE